MCGSAKSDQVAGPLLKVEKCIKRSERKREPTSESTLARSSFQLLEITLFQYLEYKDLGNCE